MTVLHTNPVRPILSPCAHAWSVPIINSTDTFFCPALLDLARVLLEQGAKPRTCRCMWLTRPAQSIQLARHHFVLTCNSAEKLLAPRSCGQFLSEEAGLQRADHVAAPRGAAAGRGDCSCGMRCVVPDVDQAMHRSRLYTWAASYRLPMAGSLWECWMRNKENEKKWSWPSLRTCISPIERRLKLIRLYSVE